MDLFMPAIAVTHRHHEPGTTGTPHHPLHHPHHHHHHHHPHQAVPHFPPHALEIPANFAQHLMESTTSWIQRNAVSAAVPASQSVLHHHHQQQQQQQQHHHHHATQIHVIHEPIIFPATGAATASLIPSSCSSSLESSEGSTTTTASSSFPPSSAPSCNQENNGCLIAVSGHQLLDVHKGKAIRLRVKVAVPVEDHPNFNFVGKLLGPRGQSLKWLQQQTQTKMAILGRGSMRDKQKEAELRRDGDPKHSHLREDLHVEITTYAPAPEAYARIAKALLEVKRFLVPDYYDEIRQQQLKELGIIIPDKRVSGPASSSLTAVASATATTACTTSISSSVSSSCASSSGGEESSPSPTDHQHQQNNNNRTGNRPPSAGMLTTEAAVTPSSSSSSFLGLQSEMSGCHVVPQQQQQEQHSSVSHFLHTNVKQDSSLNVRQIACNASHAPPYTQDSCHQQHHHHQQQQEHRIHCSSCCCNSGTTTGLHSLVPTTSTTMTEEEVSTTGSAVLVTTAVVSAESSVTNSLSVTPRVSCGSRHPAGVTRRQQTWRTGCFRQRPYPPPL